MIKEKNEEIEIAPIIDDLQTWKFEISILQWKFNISFKFYRERLMHYLIFDSHNVFRNLKFFKRFFSNFFLIISKINFSNEINIIKRDILAICSFHTSFIILKSISTGKMNVKNISNSFRLAMIALFVSYI